MAFLKEKALWWGAPVVRKMGGAGRWADRRFRWRGRCFWGDGGGCAAGVGRQPSVVATTEGGGCAAEVGGDGAPPSRGFGGRCRAGVRWAKGRAWFFSDP
jgi:hypothetical protein